MSYMLGLDLGPNSIGWACIEKESCKVLGLGSRIFQEGVNNYNQGKEASKNAVRRLARQSRRQYARKRQRKEKLKNLLRTLKMFPERQSEEAGFYALNPYSLRKKGLREKLSKMELGRALYHLNQRRGFKSNLKSGQAKEDDNKITESTNALQEKMDKEKSQTLGEYLATKDPMEERLRGRYTLRAMCIDEFDALFRNPVFQIEHIIPKSRSLDNSFANKTLCCIDENQNKGNKTPYEFYQGRDQYEEILQRIKVLPYNKQKKFRQKEISGDFINRQLNDTAYISRMSQQLLAILGYETSVAKGQSTAVLRHLWGLNRLLSKNGEGHAALKNREDHRHHALDAAVIAMTDAGILGKLSSHYKYKRLLALDRFEKPWPTFREDLKPHIEKILVSHRVTKRVSGGLHEETLYGKIERQEKDQTLYAVRKPLESLTPAMIAKIADDTVREIVKDRLRKLGVDPGQKKFTIPKEAFKKDNPLYMKSVKSEQIPIKKVRIHQPFNNMILLSSRNKTGVEPGANHHIVIYRDQDEEGRAKQRGEVCTLFEAVRRLKNKEPVIRRDLGEGKEFICSLAINELVLLDIEENQIDWQNPDHLALSPHLYRVQIVSKSITFRHHLTSVLKNEDKQEIGRQIKSPNTFKGIKVTIDRLGRIRKAND